MSDSETPMRDQMVGFLADQKAEATLSYMNRGRELESAETEALKARWIEILGEMAVLDYTNAVERDDIEAELTVRGIEPPAEALDMDRMMANIVADLARMRVEEPDKFAKMEAMVGAAALDALLARYGAQPH
jgi:hypothetical protein